MSATPIPTRRTYRSHTQPACVPCKKRKSRCKLDGDSTACLMCKVHGSQCVFPESSADTTRATTGARSDHRKAMRQISALPHCEAPIPPCQHNLPQTSSMQTASTPLADESPCLQETPFANPQVPSPGSLDESHVVGPVQSPDTQLIANYLLTEHAITAQLSRNIAGRPDQFPFGQKPILFHAVRRRPLGHTPAQSIATSVHDIITKLLEPHCEDILHVYFTKIQPCFPLLDERTFKHQYATERDKISPALLSSLYAQTIVYWRNTSTSVDQRYPDLRFIWNNANQALNSELYASPRITTITAILLNISGRPLTSMIGNGVLLSSAISLAHSLGLNRNCWDWNISSAEKLLRTRLWWAILIYDKWSSVTHGTPPHLRMSQHDVPRALESVTDNDEQVLEAGTTSIFAALASLSEVLDTYLDYVFDLHYEHNTNDDTAGITIEKRLSQWEDTLSEELRRLMVRGTNFQIKGSANLRLAYLYIRLLAQKLSLDGVKHSRTVDPSRFDYRFLHARQAAESIVLFVQELDDTVLCDFWLSFNAFALSGTVAFLLRNTLGFENGSTGTTPSRSLRLASDMIVALRLHQQRRNWDLGNICIAQYADIVEKLIASNVSINDKIPDFQEGYFSEFTEVDQMVPDLWDMFNSI